MSQPPIDSRTALLAAAQARLQVGGWNSFSFRDLAGTLGIKSSSVHHHFPTKLDLGRALLAGYSAPVLELLDGEGSAEARLAAFLDLFRQTARDGDRLCLAGMLASDLTSLSPDLRAELAVFFKSVEDRLAGLIGALEGGGPQPEKAALLLCALEGALLLHRLPGAEGKFDQTIRIAGRLIGLPEAALAPP